MIVFIVFLFLFISSTAIVCLVRIKFNDFLRVPLLIFFLILLIISTFVGIILADAYRIDRGAQLFIHNFIANPNKGNGLPLFVVPVVMRVFHTHLPCLEESGA